MDVRPVVCGLLLLVAACGSDGDAVRPAAGLTVHPVLGTSGTGTATERDQIDVGQESVVVADGQVVRIGPAALDAEQYAGAEVVQAAGGELLSITFTEDGARAYRRLTGEAACHPLADVRRMVVALHEGRVQSALRIDPSVTCGVGITSGRLGIVPRPGTSAADVLGSG